MENNERMNALMDLLQNEEAAEKVKACKDVEALTAVLREYGLDMDREVLEKLAKSCGTESKELSAEELDGVSGGGWFRDFLVWLYNRCHKKNEDVIRDMVNKL